MLGGWVSIRPDGTHDVVLQASYPSAANTWTAKAIEVKPLSVNWAVVASAICALVKG